MSDTNKVIVIFIVSELVEVTVKYFQLYFNAFKLSTKRHNHISTNRQAPNLKNEVLYNILKFYLLKQYLSIYFTSYVA